MDHPKRHARHRDLHEHHKHVEKRQGDKMVQRAVGDYVRVTMNGKLVSWVNQYSGSAAATNAPSSDGFALAQTNVAAVPTTAGSDPGRVQSGYRTIAASPTTASTESGSSGKSWTRHAYYNAELGQADGITFLNHFGGTKGVPGTAAGGPA